MEEQKSNQANAEEYVCTECGADVSINDKVCPKCGADISELEEEKQESISQAPTRFNTLLGIGKFIAGFGWLVVIVGIVALIFGISKLDESMGITSLIGGFSFIVLGIVSVAYGQLIECFVSIEKNTKETNELLKEKS
jgi:cytochrome c biogenesis protein CcdA